MIILLLALSILMIVWAVKRLNAEPYSDDGWMVMIIVGGFATTFTFIALLCLLGTVVNGGIIDDKIALYAERNEEINKSLEVAIEKYTNYESDTFEKLKHDDATVLVNAYPELKAQPLIQEQIDTYVSNTKEITSLREEKINLKLAWWWLSFGVGSN